MTDITAHRHLIKFYLFLFFRLLFFGVLATIAFTLHNQATSKIGEYILILMGLGLIFLSVISIVVFFKNTPAVKLNLESITFNHSEKLYWTDLEKIDLTGKKSFSFMDFDRREAVTLKFKGEREKYIFDDMYSNSSQIKVFIQQVVVDKSAVEAIKLQPVPSVIHETFIKYNGYQLLSFTGIMMWFLLTPAIFLFIKAALIFNIDQMIGFVAFGIIWFFFWGFKMYYFELSDNYFEMRLHNIPWFKKVYRLSDIKEIVFEQPYKRPTSLRIITNDFENTLYPASTLRNKRWMELKADLEKKNIKVRNEGVSYEPFEFKLYN